MSEPLMFWPWPWWTVICFALALALGSLLCAKIALHYRNRSTQRIARLLPDSGFVADSETFCLGGGKNTLVVSSRQLAVVDLCARRVVQAIPITSVSALKIYEESSDQTTFRIVLKGGAQSRKVMTTSIVEFARLFRLLTTAKKRIDYIQESV